METGVFGLQLPMRSGYGGKVEGGNGKGDDKSGEFLASMTCRASMIAMACCLRQAHGEHEDVRRYSCLNNDSGYGEYTESIECLSQNGEDRRRRTLQRAVAALPVIKPINADLRPTPRRCTEPEITISRYTEAGIR